MLKEFVDSLRTLTRQATRESTLEFDGRKYVYSDAQDKYTRVGHHTQPDTLKVRTIAGLVDFAESMLPSDMREDAEHFVHLESISRLVLRSTLLEGKRDDFVEATAPDFSAAFDGRWRGNADMVEHITKHYVDTEERAGLITLVGNVIAGSEVETTDDGVSQRVQLTDGVRKWKGDPKKSYTLIPRGGFEQVNEVPTSFALRARTEEDAPPSFKLIANDQQGWEASHRIELAEAIDAVLKSRNLNIPIVS